jgi:DMSO/TMAO reductase YedYZ molybdopterin-dependent catalytic subunit
MRRRVMLKAAGSALLGSLLGRAAGAQPGGQLLGHVSFLDADRRSVPLDVAVGTGLDGRRFTDLSTLTADTLVTPTGRFFVRTRATVTKGRESAWRLHVGLTADAMRTLALEELTPLTMACGDHLLECAGNVEPFGLMSAARWHGVPVLTLLERVGAMRARGRLVVSGEDDHTYPWRTSTAGASWIFSPEDLARSGAFLATGMNDTPLPPDHGGPLRLVVPGWYGCACIKWVSHLAWVSEDAPVTTQMAEFALRTHQEGQPELARDYAPPVIDTAAMPVRIEKRRGSDGLFYRVVGIVWGGATPTAALDIRFARDGPFVRVDECPLPPSTSSWGLWSHEWRPQSPGRYTVELRVRDKAIRTRRLDRGYYSRTVVLDQV